MRPATGANTSGKRGYFGPRPLPTADRDAFLAAVSGHVLAKGELVGTYRQTIDPPKQ